MDCLTRVVKDCKECVVKSMVRSMSHSYGIDVVKSFLKIKYQGYDMFDKNKWISTDNVNDTLTDNMLVDVLSGITELNVIVNYTEYVKGYVVSSLTSKLRSLFSYLSIPVSVVVTGKSRVHLIVKDIYDDEKVYIDSMLISRDRFGFSKTYESVYLIDNDLTTENISNFNDISSYRKTVCKDSSCSWSCSFNKCFRADERDGILVYKNKKLDFSDYLNSLRGVHKNNPCNEIESSVSEPVVLLKDVLGSDIDLNDLVSAGKSSESNSISGVEKDLLKKYKKLGTPDTIKSDKTELLELKDKLITYQSLIDQQSTEIRNLTKVVLNDDSSELKEYKALGSVKELKDTLNMFNKLYSVIFPKIEDDIKKGIYKNMVDPESLRFLE